MRWYLWGLNPRRLERLADLKSAPLDHSGKIPGQIDKELDFSPAFFKAFYTSSPGLWPHLCVGRLLAASGLLSSFPGIIHSQIDKQNASFLVYGRFGS